MTAKKIRARYHNNTPKDQSEAMMFDFLNMTDEERAKVKIASLRGCPKKIGGGFAV